MLQGSIGGELTIVYVIVIAWWCILHRYGKHNQSWEMDKFNVRAELQQTNSNSHEYTRAALGGSLRLPTSLSGGFDVLSIIFLSRNRKKQFFAAPVWWTYYLSPTITTCFLTMTRAQWCRDSEKAYTTFFFLRLNFKVHFDSKDETFPHRATSVQGSRERNNSFICLFFSMSVSDRWSFELGDERWCDWSETFCGGAVCNWRACVFRPVGGAGWKMWSRKQSFSKDNWGACRHRRCVAGTNTRCTAQPTFDSANQTKLRFHSFVNWF